MKPSIWRKLDVIARQLVPCALTFAMLVVGVVPLHVTAVQSIFPSLPLIAVFYWTLHRPDLMPAVAVFAIGLLQDILFGLPIGISACVLVCVHAAISTQRRFFIGKSFGIVWLGFGIVAVVALSLSWVMICAYYGTLVTPEKFIFQALTTVGFFPLLCWALSRCQLSLIEQA